MEFSDRTKLVFADSIKDLMVHTPLDRITVTQVVENCSATRQTFYRNFKDKYDLVNWYFDRIVQNTIRQMGVSLTLREALVKKFEYMIQDRCFFISALSSRDYNNLMDYDYQCILAFYRGVAETNGTVTDDIQFLLEFYCHGSMDMTASWVRGGMQESPSVMSARLVEAMPEKLAPYLSTLTNFVHPDDGCYTSRKV